MRTIEVLAKRHDEWMKMARSFKVSEDDAKELVQEMYLRLDKYVKDVDKIMYNETEVNTFYVYTAISNLITTGFHKTGLNWRHKKTKISYFEELFEHKDHSEEIKETISLLDRLDVENADDMESFSSLVDSQCMFESLFGNIKKDIDDVVATWYWYDAKLFKLYYDKGMNEEAVRSRSYLCLDYQPSFLQYVVDTDQLTATVSQYATVAEPYLLREHDFSSLYRWAYHGNE